MAAPIGQSNWQQQGGQGGHGNWGGNHQGWSNWGNGGGKGGGKNWNSKGNGKGWNNGGGGKPSSPITLNLVTPVPDSPAMMASAYGLIPNLTGASPGWMSQPQMQPYQAQQMMQQPAPSMPFQNAGMQPHVPPQQALHGNAGQPDVDTLQLLVRLADRLGDSPGDAVPQASPTRPAAPTTKSQSAVGRLFDALTRRSRRKQDSDEDEPEEKPKKRGRNPDASTSTSTSTPSSATSSDAGLHTLLEQQQRLIMTLTGQLQTKNDGMDPNLVTHPRPGPRSAPTSATPRTTPPGLFPGTPTTPVAMTSDSFQPPERISVETQKMFIRNFCAGSAQPSATDIAYSTWLPLIARSHSLVEWQDLWSTFLPGTPPITKAVAIAGLLQHLMVAN